MLSSQFTKNFSNVGLIHDNFFLVLIDLGIMAPGQPHLKHSFIKQNTLSTNYANEH